VSDVPINTIICGDCLEVMKGWPDGCVDITVTSPPYNTLPKSEKASGLHAERKSGVNKWIRKAVNGYFDARPEDEYQKWISDVMTECARVSKGLVWLNHKVRYRKGVGLHPLRWIHLPLYAEVVWDRRVSMALNCKRYAPSHEGLWAFGRPHWWDDAQNKLLSVWRLGFDRDANEHPCSFPLEIAARPIGSSCPPGGTVFDPFCGSGTTCLAAQQLGRKFIGIDLSEEYCQIARERLKAVDTAVPVSEARFGQTSLFVGGDS